MNIKNEDNENVNPENRKTRVIKYGGIKYVNNVPLEQINSFIEGLPEDKRSSMAEVTKNT